MAAVGVLAPATASASTAQVNSGDDVYYYADPGETNNLSVTRSGKAFTLVDPGATILTTGPECASVNIHQAVCTVIAANSVYVRLDDQSDAATVAVGNVRTSLNGGDGADTLTGGPGPDSLNGGYGDDTESGGDGADYFADEGSGDGADSFSGGGGLDQLNYSSHAGDLRVDTDGVADDGEGCPGPGCEGDNVKVDIEGLSGGSGSDVLSGGAGPNSIYGAGGDDTILGDGGADTLIGGNDDDTIRGGGGGDLLAGSQGRDRVFGEKGDDAIESGFFDDEADSFSGGGGTDLVDYSGANSSVRVDLDGKADDGVAGERDNVRPDVEDIRGSQFDDVLIGRPGANELEGGSGNDRLIGDRGLDGLIGGDGNDFLNGGKGRDLLEGDGGSDRITSRDRDPDEVECGSAIDRVLADRADRVSADCDRVKRG